MSDNPLGKTVEYPQEYAPAVLFPIARIESRRDFPDPEMPPFHGADILTAWDLGWLDDAGKPVAGVATIQLPHSSPNLIESKSLKLYLNSLSHCRHADHMSLIETMVKDLSAAAGGQVSVNIHAMSDPIAHTQPTGICLDELEIDDAGGDISATVLSTDQENVVGETLYTHLLRSNCPITNQPDMGSLLVRYSGPQIDRKGLLEYIVSYRNHNGFHEACVERIFVDINAQCAPDHLTVYARYNRRGGIDINPFRSNFEEVPDNSRYWRQ